MWDLERRMEQRTVNIRVHKVGGRACPGARGRDGLDVRHSLVQVLAGSLSDGNKSSTLPASRNGWALLY
jgi:hypothetical protein